MIIRKLIVIITIVFFSGKTYAQDKDEVLNNFEKIKDTVEYREKIGDLLNQIVNKKIILSIKDIDPIIKLGEDLKHNHGLGIAYRIKGELHKRKLEYLIAIKNFEKAIEHYKKTRIESGIARTYNDMFVVEYIKGNFEKSVSYLLESKKYFERLNDSSNLAYLHNNLGAVYWSLKDYDASEEAFSQSLALQQKGRKLRIKGTIMSNLGSIYLIQKKYEKAKDIIQKSIIFNKEVEEVEGLALSYSTLSDVYIATKEYNKARVYNDSTLHVLRQDENDITSIQAKQRLGLIELKFGNYKEAERMLETSREAFKKIDSETNLLENYKLSSQLDSVRGNLVGALAWQRQYQKLSDQRIAEISTKKIENAEARYQAELEQLRKIDAQEKREQQSKAELFRYRVFTFIVLGVLLISLLFLFWVIKTRRERKQLITNLNKSNQIKNKLFSIISHDLKNEIHGLEASLNLMKDNEISTEEFEEIIPLLANRTNQTSILLNNLLNWSKSQMNELSAKPINFDVSEVISNKFTFFKPKAHQKNIKLINKLDSTFVFADRDMVGIVAQNLIANAIKFCESGDTISLISREKEHHYEIGFADTGVGIAPDNIKKLFAEETFTTHGTQNESGTGLGLRICKELIELNKGNIKVESTYGEGSTFIILLPKAAA